MKARRRARGKGRATRGKERPKVAPSREERRLQRYRDDLLQMTHPIAVKDLIMGRVFDIRERRIKRNPEKWPDEHGMELINRWFKVM